MTESGSEMSPRAFVLGVGLSSRDASLVTGEVATDGPPPPHVVPWGRLRP
jgi:hypothetical protein